MHYLWSRLPQIQKKILSKKHLLILLDYDGTLAPITPTPEQARLNPQTKLVLQRLSQKPHVTIAVISGRGLADLKRMVGLRNLGYAGNHGFELWWRDNRQTVRIPRTARRVLSEVKRILLKVSHDFEGAIMEDKGLSLSLHYRLVNAKEVTRLKAEFRNYIMPYVRSGRVRVVKGKRVFDVRPNVAWTKGHAALWFTKRMGSPSCLPIYIGDDQTDEDAFSMLKTGLTVRVGEHRKSKARYYVRGVREVIKFLQ